MYKDFDDQEFSFIFDEKPQEKIYKLRERSTCRLSSLLLAWQR